MQFIARVIKKPKGNGISPEGCKKIDANLALPCNYFFALCRSLFVFFRWLCAVATLANFAYFNFLYGSYQVFSQVPALSFEMPVQNGSF